MVQTLKSTKFSDSLKKQIYELNVWNDKAIEENENRHRYMQVTLDLFENLNSDEN